MNNKLNEAVVIEVNAGSPRLAQIEELFERVIESDCRDVMALDKIRMLFNLEFRPIEFLSLSIVKSRNEEDFFGAQVMPAVSHIEEIVARGLNLKDIKRMSGPERMAKCVIEIDERLIFDCKLSARELMAVILHEIGHTLSDKQMAIPKMFCLDTIAALPAGIVSAVSTAVITKNNIYGALGGFLVAGILSLYSHTGRYWFNLNREKEADSVAIKCGYGRDLFAASEKIIETNLVQSNSKLSRKDDAKRMARWGFFQILHMRQRQHSVLRILRAELKDEQSPSAREVLQKQIAALEQMEKDRGVKKAFGFGVHQYGESMDLLNESIRSFIDIHKRGLSPLEIDEIEIEIGRIETSDDKIYLVQRIHKDILIANKAIDKLRRSGHDADIARIQTIRDYIEQLKALVPRIKAVKTQINPYTFVIKYPKGDYEEGGDGWE